MDYAVSPPFHYLDDFLTMGAAHTSACQIHMDRAFTMFGSLGCHQTTKKCEGPTMVLIFLGIQLDSVNQIAKLPADKVQRIVQLLHTWSPKKTCTQRELQSLIGHLHHACKVMQPIRSFLRRMIYLLRCFRHHSHPIRLNTQFCRDLQRWISFFHDWNGISLLLSAAITPLLDLSISSDTSGRLAMVQFVPISVFFCLGRSFLIPCLS